MNETLDTMLKEALDITQKAQIPSHLEPIAFGKVIDLLTGGNGVVRKPSMGAPGNKSEYQQAEHSRESATDTIAAKLGLDVSVVEQCFASDPTKRIELIIGAGRLETNKKQAAQQIAILIAGARQIAGIEEWTTAKLIGETCQLYNKLDRGHFARDIKELHDFFGFRGKGKMMAVKINRPGMDRLSLLITTLTEQGD